MLSRQIYSISATENSEEPELPAGGGSPEGVTVPASSSFNVQWSEADLPLKPKGAPGKLQIAQRLRAETTMTLKWIADHLKMGSKTHLAHLLYWDSRKNATQVVNTID